MAFGTDLSLVYDDLFPVPKGLRTLQKWMRGVGGVRSVADCGCATGEQLLPFAESDLLCLGIDPDPSLVSAARRKLAAWPKTRIEEGKLDDLSRLTTFPLDLVMCLGNALVRVPQVEAGAFISDAAKALAYGGSLLLQILNYERLFREGVTELPPIRAADGAAEFRRRCTWESERKLSLNVSLRRSSGDEPKILHEEFPLYPLYPEELRKMVEKAGFFDIRLYGNFSRGNFQPESRFLILLARKARSGGMSGSRWTRNADSA